MADTNAFQPGEIIGKQVKIRIISLITETKEIEAEIVEVNSFWSNPSRGEPRFVVGMRIRLEPNGNPNNWIIKESSNPGLPWFILYIGDGRYMPSGEKIFEHYR